MPRPNKSGLSYFPIDINICLDDKIQLIEAEYGLTGFAVIIKLFIKIYQNGYYYHWTEKEHLLFCKNNTITKELLNNIINDCFKWNLFNNNLFKKYQILTSAGIQKQYLAITERRKEISLIQQYLLVKVDNDNINLINVDINEVNVDIKKQIETKANRKEIESKVKDIITYLNEKSQKNFETDTKDTIKLISARLTKYTTDDLKKVIDYKCNQWINDVKMNEFLRPKTLFNETNFANYLVEAKKTIPKDNYKPLTDEEKKLAGITI